MANDTKNHGWRADDFTLVRDGWTAQVARGWCADDEDKHCWRFLAWPLDETGGIGDHDIPASVQHHGMTYDAAIAAAEAYIAERLEDVNPKVYAFAGAEAAP